MVWQNGTRICDIMAHIGHKGGDDFTGPDSDLQSRTRTCPAVGFTSSHAREWSQAEGLGDSGVLGARAAAPVRGGAATAQRAHVRGVHPGDSEPAERFGDAVTLDSRVRLRLTDSD